MRRQTWWPHRAAAAVAVAGAITGAIAWWHDRCDRREVAAMSSDHDPLGLIGSLQQTGSFCRDSLLGRLLHRGTVSVRENTAEESLHITLSGNRLSAHIDRHSPLVEEHASWIARYSVPRAIVHTLAHLVEAVRRLGARRPGSHRVELECQKVEPAEESTGQPPARAPGGGQQPLPAAGRRGGDGDGGGPATPLST